MKIRLIIISLLLSSFFKILYGHTYRINCLEKDNILFGGYYYYEGQKTQALNLQDIEIVLLTYHDTLIQLHLINQSELSFLTRNLVSIEFGT